MARETAPDAGPITLRIDPAAFAYPNVPLPDVWTAGIVCGLRPLKTKKGDRMAVFMLDDVAGSLECVVFPETFNKHGSIIEADAMVLVRGKFEKDDESARIVATELQPIAMLQERTTKEVVIHLAPRTQGRTVFEQLAELLARHRGDRRVFLELDVNGREKPLRVRSEVAMRVRPSGSSADRRTAHPTVNQYRTRDPRPRSVARAMGDRPTPPTDRERPAPGAGTPAPDGRVVKVSCAAAGEPQPLCGIGRRAAFLGRWPPSATICPTTIENCGTTAVPRASRP